MARIQLLLCLTIVFASVSLLDVVSAHLKIKPALPEIEDPKTVQDVETYTVKVVMVFVSDLEKECPKTNKFKAFFEKLREFAKYVCPINSQSEYRKDMRAKAGSLFQAIASFAVGKIRKEIQEEKTEAVNTYRWMKTMMGKIISAPRKDEKLTTEQVKEIKEGILKWETVITKVTNTMVQISQTSSSSFEDTTGSSSDFGSPVGSPSTSSSDFESSTESPSGSSGSPSTSSSDFESSTESPSGSSGSGTVFTDTTGTASPTKSPSSSRTATASSSESTAITLTEVEADTSKEVMTFLMNLEKKCPPKEEYKSFFEQLKVTMTTASTEVSKSRKSFFARIKTAAGKLSDAMTFMMSRVGSKSVEVKKSLEAYQADVMKAVQELEAIHSQIVSQNKGKKDGALTCTPTQQKEIQVTITKWEQVTTKFVEAAIQSETQSSSTTSS